ncbi:hypothetical protein CEXT_497091 [Caerostris extrusa]|uniref:Uncharacterized protein n=1 Tax=Caerostris extrusa TaxID=172846 RepID=A0AAV4V2N8_CAEEX|nr:hypothetical protein CEXT_497091 [Caerostris extrusa]
MQKEYTRSEVEMFRELHPGSFEHCVAGEGDSLELEWQRVSLLPLIMRNADVSTSLLLVVHKRTRRIESFGRKNHSVIPPSPRNVSLARYFMNVPNLHWGWVQKLPSPFTLPASRQTDFSERALPLFPSSLWRKIPQNHRNCICCILFGAREHGEGGAMKDVEFAISFGYRSGFINGEDFCSIPERGVKKDSKGLSNLIKNSILLFARENPRGVEN